MQGAGKGIKRLSVSVVQMPEAQQWALEQYLGTVFKWRMFRGDVRRDDVVAAMSRPLKRKTRMRQTCHRNCRFGIENELGDRLAAMV